METTIAEKRVSELSAEELESLLSAKKAEAQAKENEERKAYEELKTKMVLELVSEASAISNTLKDFKTKAFSEMDALFQLLCRYSNRKEGKGNFTLQLPEGVRISYKNQDLGFFDERSAQAEKHIIDFVNSYYSEHDSTRKLITSLLERKKGALDIKLVQKLYSMENEFENKNWKNGIKLLRESWTTSESKAYIRFEVKVKEVWQSIDLNFASIKTA